ncbi:hypothetical protein Tco_0128888 [Tanacetum coccineum]
MAPLPGRDARGVEVRLTVEIVGIVPITYPSQCFKSFCYDDDDDYDYEGSSIPLRDIIFELPLSIAITPDLPITNSLIMGDDHLSTIPEKESDEVIKSSVEDFVPIPSESEDTSKSDSDCDLPSCDDFSPINVYEEKFMTFSNPLFDSNDDFTSSDDKSLSVEDVPEDNDECFDPGGEINKIDAFLDMNISTDIENGYHDSEGDIIYLESLIINDTIPNLPPEIFLDHDPKNLKDVRPLTTSFDPSSSVKLSSCAFHVLASSNM